MKKYYAVIDTNVIVSAALRWKSVPGSHGTVRNIRL